MKPAYWIGIMAIVGALLALLLNRLLGWSWLDPVIGTVAGVIIGVIIFERMK
jgi:Co/Zn/Cd efflux system component